MTYDIEEMLDNIETILKASLNTKIAAIEAEKTVLGKPIGLPAVDTNAYIQQTWSDKILQYNPAIFYGVEEIQSTGANTATLEVYKIFVEVVFVDSGNDLYGIKRLHRYSRALKEVFQENYDALPWSTKVNIETVRPISFKLEADSSEDIRVGGVSIVAGLA